jgi:hypothetical protein
MDIIEQLQLSMLERREEIKQRKLGKKYLGKNHLTSLWQFIILKAI